MALVLFFQKDYVKLEFQQVIFCHGKMLLLIKSKLIAVNTKLVLGHKLYNFVFFCCSDERKKSASSLDDLFLLYAALQFNQSCYIVTGDYMRDHISKLKENLTELCSRWILSKSMKTFQRVSPNTWVS